MKKSTKEKIGKANKGAKSGHWKGGSKSTDALNARRAWEKHWGKKVPAGYIVHHKDGNPTNNAISNLSLKSRAAHNSAEKKGKSLAEQKRAAKNKPNIARGSEKQRRFR